jgi:hypothetical protein
MVGIFLVHVQVIGIHGLIRFITTWTSGSHHLPLYNIFYDSPQRLHLNVIFPKTPKLGVLKFSKLKLLPLWRPIVSYGDLGLSQGLKQHYSPCRELSRDMWHTTFTYIIQGDSWFLVVGNQIDILTSSPSIDDNLCF